MRVQKSKAYDSSMSIFSHQEWISLGHIQKEVEELVQGLLDEISYLLDSPKPEVEDIRTLYEIRNRLVSQRRASLRPKSRKFPLSPDEMVDVIGKQLGVK